MGLYRVKVKSRDQSCELLRKEPSYLKKPAVFEHGREAGPLLTYSLGSLVFLRHKVSLSIETQESWEQDEDSELGVHELA